MKNNDLRYTETLETALRASLDYLNSQDSRSVAATVSAKELRERLTKPLSESGIAPGEVINELVRGLDGGLIGSTNGRFFGWVIGGSLPVALAADWMVSTWDQNATLYATSPAAAIVEEIAGVWLKDILRLPPQASFALTTGCQMAHATCLASARHALLARRDWNVEEQGLYGAPPIRILSSGERHGSIARAVRLLGLGTSQVVDLPVDSNGRLEVETLEAALKADPTAPTIVILQAGDINIGAFDPFDTLIPLAKSFGAWVHIDGAFGLWAAASPAYRHFIKDIDAADSWATDGHKWLNVPFDCGYAFVADPESHRATMSHRAVYLTHNADARDELNWTPDWSRRARGIPTYAALRNLGRNGIAELIERCCEHASALVTGIGNLAGAEILWHPTLNEGLVRFVDPRPLAIDEDHSRRTDAVIAAIVKDGEAFFGGTTWRGMRAMRISVCNWQTSDDDVERAIASIAKVLGDMRS
jgi:glutamate/tyrosine decarboxylase-like PLP-dependent enzyme